MKAYLESMETRLLERMEKTETNLLLEIRAISTAVKARIGRIEASDTTLNVRMAALEDRMDLLETRRQ